MYASRFGYVNPGITGVGFEFIVIAAVVIGGVSINGGVGSVLGRCSGCILLGMVNVALPMLGVSGFWQAAIYGAVILIALIDRPHRARSAASPRRSSSRGPRHDRRRAPRPARRAGRRPGPAALAGAAGAPRDRHADPADRRDPGREPTCRRSSRTSLHPRELDLLHGIRAGRAGADHGDHLGRDRPVAGRDDGAVGLRLRRPPSRPGCRSGSRCSSGLADRRRARAPSTPGWWSGCSCRRSSPPSAR